MYKLRGGGKSDSLGVHIVIIQFVLLTLILSQDFFLDPDGPSILSTLELTESPGIRFRYYLGIL